MNSCGVSFQRARTASCSRAIRCISFLVIILSPYTAAMASSEERAQMLRANVLRVFLEDGWQLAQESPSQLVLERRMEGFGGFVFQALTTGPNGTNPVARFSISFAPISEHYTEFFQSLVMTSQNAFGRPTTVPSRNAKDRAYIDGKLTAASEMLPEKYRFQPSVTRPKKK